MRKLFLDDERNPYDPTWDVVRSYDAFVKYITENGMPDLISFDHDLAFEHYPLCEQNPGVKIPYDNYKEKTGYHAVQWLIETGRIDELKGAYVHTQNPAGRENILRALLRARVSTKVVAWRVGKIPVLLPNTLLG